MDALELEMYASIQELGRGFSNKDDIKMSMTYFAESNIIIPIFWTQ